MSCWIWKFPFQANGTFLDNFSWLVQGLLYQRISLPSQVGCSRFRQMCTETYFHKCFSQFSRALKKRHLNCILNFPWRVIPFGYNPTAEPVWGCWWGFQPACGELWQVKISQLSAREWALPSYWALERMAQWPWPVLCRHPWFLWRFPGCS